MTTENTKSDSTKKMSRLSIDAPRMEVGGTFELSEKQHHYVRNVMRLEVGGQLRAFNGVDGEWLAEVSELTKKKGIISFVEQLREQTEVPEVFMYCSPVKKEVFEFIVEKACELGVKSFHPVLCDHTSVHKVNEDRLNLIAVEASEQSERMEVMAITPPAHLKSVLESWDKGHKLILCLERQDLPSMVYALIEQEIRTPISILVGPEGGFSDAEVAYMTGLDFVVPVSLGANVLRTETAMISALLCLQVIGIKTV